MTAGRAWLGVGAVAALGWLAMAVFGADTMASYLAAWLFALAIPAGALPLVMMAEAFGVFSLHAMPLLRRTLLCLPPAAVLALPVLFRTGVLFRRPGIADALPAWWMSPGFFIARALVILAVLSVLALVFSRAPRAPRPGLALFGCLCHATLMALAGFDWVMSLQPGIASSAFGVVLIASQVSLAASLAAFLLAVATTGRASVPPSVGKLVSVALGIWLFVQFVQFLSVWSGDLPAEIVWYGVRLQALGLPALAFAATAAALGLLLLPWLPGRSPAICASLAAMLVLMHLVETLWLVTPAFRGRFTITLADALATAGFAGLAFAFLASIRPTPQPELRLGG